MEENRKTAIDALTKTFPDLVSCNAQLRLQHSHTTSHIPSQAPEAVFFAENTHQIAQAVKLLNDHNCPIIPFGTGTSLEGHVNAPLGGVSIDLSRMDKILSVNQNDMDVTVQPGVTRKQLNQHLRDTGLFFPIDPGADASLGGMASTRASGTNAVRYGTMRNAVLALEAVLPDGSIMRSGGRARKSSAGYDLTSLFVGSEGTLGIITELTLRLHGIPQHISSGICSFPDITNACETVIETIQMGIGVARIELLDALQVKACNLYSKSNLPETPLLLLEFHGNKESVTDDMRLFQTLAETHGGHNIQWSATPEERSKLWQVRHDAFWAASSLIPDSRVFTTDVCVPISKLAECVDETQRDIAQNNLISPIVGHVGDGNFHCLILMPNNQPEMEMKINAFCERLSQRAIDMGGTCTGEHGIGQGKQAFLAIESPSALPVMKAIKQQLDPKNIMNPGKIFSSSGK